MQLGTWSADSPFLQQQQQQQQQGEDAHRSSADGRPLENGEVGVALEAVDSCEHQPHSMVDTRQKQSAHQPSCTVASAQSSIWRLVAAAVAHSFTMYWGLQAGGPKERRDRRKVRQLATVTDSTPLTQALGALLQVPSPNCRCAQRLMSNLLVQ